MRRNPKVSGGTSLTRPLTIRDSLIAAVLGADYSTPRVVKPQKAKTRPPSKGSDEMVLEVRRLRELGGLAPSAIQAHMADLGYGLSLDRINQLIQYQTRSHLIPAQGAEPYITKAAP